MTTRFNTGSGKDIDPAQLPKAFEDAAHLATLIEDTLEEHSAQEILRIDLRGKSSVADYMVVASGRSSRHVNALADYAQKALKDIGLTKMGVEGQDASDWILIDAGDVIVHIFRPEVREFYNIEKIWMTPSERDKADRDTAEQATGA